MQAQITLTVSLSEAELLRLIRGSGGAVATVTAAPAGADASAVPGAEDPAQLDQVELCDALPTSEAPDPEARAAAEDRAMAELDADAPAGRYAAKHNGGRGRSSRWAVFDARLDRQVGDWGPREEAEALAERWNADEAVAARDGYESAAAVRADREEEEATAPIEASEPDAPLPWDAPHPEPAADAEDGPSVEDHCPICGEYQSECTCAEQDAEETAAPAPAAEISPPASDDLSPHGPHRYYLGIVEGSDGHRCVVDRSTGEILDDDLPFYAARDRARALNGLPPAAPPPPTPESDAEATEVPEGESHAPVLAAEPVDEDPADLVERRTNLLIREALLPRESSAARWERAASTGLSDYALERLIRSELGTVDRDGRSKAGTFRIVGHSRPPCITIYAIGATGYQHLRSEALYTRVRRIFGIPTPAPAEAPAHA